MDTFPLWLFLLVAGAAGLELGGLATIFIQRWIDEQPICRPGRSQCPDCGCKLSWLDTIPLLGYFLLRGKCRHCGQPIGAQYVLVELSCLAWSLALAHHCGVEQWPSFVAYLVLGCMLVAGSFIDFETMLLPDRITMGGTGLALAASFLPGGPGWQEALAGAVAGGAFFWVVQQGYRLWRKEEGLGTGDVKLMTMIGAMTGLSGLPLAVLAGAVTSSLASLVYMLRPGGKGLCTRIPFGPFLALGCMLTVLYGEPVMRWWNYH